MSLLETIEKDFDENLARTPPFDERSLCSVGTAGFRWASQIDPLWNAFLLGHTLQIAERIEKARIEQGRGVVFSYRYSPDATTGQLFSRSIGWRQYEEKSAENARNSSVVLTTDISNFYSRIYHHRLENALRRAAPNSHSPSRIMKTLGHLSKNVSYGLPVGGAAARILSELLLNRVDRLLHAEGIVFCRYSDDYRIFVDSRKSAYNALVFLNEKLLENEGLSLQKSKTRIMTSSEFLSAASITSNVQFLTPEERAARGFLSIRIHYDPYSPTREEDYQALRDQVSKFDVVGMLATEMKKSRIHTKLVRRLISAIAVLDDDDKEIAIKSLIDNIDSLYPVFPKVAVVLNKLISDGQVESLKEEIYSHFREMISTESHILRVPINLAFAVRLLVDDPSDETDSILNSVYRSSSRPFVRRDIILAMGRREADYWLSDVVKKFNTLHIWEQRASMICSYVLGDEGKHWRGFIKKNADPLCKLVADWAANKKQLPGWRVPL